MKKNILLGVALTVLAGCSQDVLVDNEKGGSSGLSDKIEFGLSMADNATKASRSSGNTFVSGDEIAVFGFQTTDGETDKIFNDQIVSFDGTDWKYSPAKYWNRDSRYDFYAMFPQDIAHTFTDSVFTVDSFVVANSAVDQVDVMIAKRKLNSTPFNTVEFVFTHMLSNVNFYFKGVASEASAGVKSVDVVSFDVTGLNSKGSYSQTGWSNSAVAEGMWVIDTASVYNLPVVTDTTYTVGKPAMGLATDLLLMPQDIQSEALISVKYRLNYIDGTSVTFKKSLPFAGIKSTTETGGRTLASWYPSTRYNYYLTVNPSKLNGAEGTVSYDHSDSTEVKNTDVTVIVIPDTDGDLEDEYWIDEDGDGTPDYPLVWADPDPTDEDNTQYLYPDKDGDGVPDGTKSDEDDDPDILWIDTDGDGKADTEVTRPTPTIKPVDSSIPVDTGSVNYPDICFIDFNGGVDGYNEPSAWLVVGDLTNDDIDDDYMIDTDGDGVGDITILWKDIDGDGKLEGIADKDGDGILTEADTYDGDGLDYNGKTNYYDVIMVDTDGDGIADTELERVKTVDDPEIETETAIEFSATVEEWTEAYDAGVNIYNR